MGRSFISLGGDSALERAVRRGTCPGWSSYIRTRRVGLVAPGRAWPPTHAWRRPRGDAGILAVREGLWQGVGCGVKSVKSRAASRLPLNRIAFRDSSHHLIIN